MSDTPRTDEIWGSMHGSGYQMMLLAQKLERELAALQKECGTAIRKSLNEITYREMAEVEADKWLRLCTEWSEANVKLILRAEKAEKELADAKRERDAANVELQRIHANELPGGWTEQLQMQINARHAAEARALAAETALEVIAGIRKCDDRSIRSNADYAMRVLQKRDRAIKGSAT